MQSIAFEVPGPPRTKKTSNRIVQIRSKSGGRSFTKILPSEAFEGWFKSAMTHAPLIRARVARAGVQLPITAPVQVSAAFYRERLSGDLTGFMQALADWLQEPRRSESGKTTRQGAGIISDDSQIVSWDGTKLLKDASRPRIEVEITIVGPEQGVLLP